MIKIEDNYNNWEEHARQHKPIVETGRKPIPLVKQLDRLYYIVNKFR
jgi:hypothetical protein